MQKEVGASGVQEVSYLFTMNGVIYINKNRMFSDRVHAPLSAIYSKKKVCYSVGSHQAFHRNHGITVQRVGYFEASGPGVKRIYHGDSIYIAFRATQTEQSGSLKCLFRFLLANLYGLRQKYVILLVEWVIRKKFNVIGRKTALQCIRDYR